ncbi:MAG: hypothetical protein ACOCTI_00600 [Phycisphaeraceae bacterium]
MKYLSTLLATALLCLAIATPADAAEREWGVNFWAHDYYTTDAVFVDATRVFSYGPKDPRPDPATEQGIPIDATRRVFSALNAYPDGTYKLRYDGAGRIEIKGGGQILPDSIRQENGHTYADVRITPGEDYVEMYFHHENPDSDPIRNVRLICPGYDVDTDQIFRDEAWKRLRPFTTLRFMDWNWANKSNAGSWEQRRLEDDFFQTAGFGNRTEEGGMAYELMAGICNEGGKDMWMCVPHTADEQYIQEMAKLLHEELDPELTLYIELSNELWNFSQGPELAKRMMGEDWSYSSKEMDSLYKGAVAPKLLQISRAFKEAFADRPGKLKVVLAGQISNAWHMKQTYEGWAEAGVEPGEVIDAIAIAPYMHAGHNRETVDQLIDDMRKDARGKMAEGIRSHAEYARQADADLIAYEGGQHVFFRNVAKDELIDQVQDDPRMRELYQILAEEWEKAGGGLFVHYTYAGYPWGLLPTGASEGSVKYDAVMKLLLPEGDATLDGEVTFADFEVLEQHFGQSGWWMNGDFNGDRQVNAEDLELLRENLSGLTTQQEQRVEKLAD